MKRILARIVIRVSFYPSLLFNRTMCLIGFWRLWDRIDDHLIIGILPSRSDLSKLSRLGVHAIVNMCSECDGHADHMTAFGMVQLHLPTLDFHSPSEKDLVRGVDFIRKQAMSGRTVYVHCKAGRGRSVILAVCYLMVAHTIDAQTAYERIKGIRPQVDRGIVSRVSRLQFHSSLPE